MNPVSFRQAQAHTQPPLQPSKNRYGLVSRGYEVHLPVPGQLEKPLLICARGNAWLSRARSQEERICSQ